ncbi:hypothetical protein GOC90_31845 [Sinorhizobium medicae]|nr:hypothetical protein [Sinorhizobium medicae]MDX0506963.1 hypothetical protein [Sinorhizobium medicae]MDX0593425.1 hypothetical protein [Sinorhizobium medicae]MDX0611902.1 hypothetical protein [Sinorhizobium medicae]MDX0642761.1 hypothetical protein [Sinorhizobium medicae]
MAVFRKDETLDLLAEDFNVAQFVSFAPSPAGPQQQFCRMAGLAPNHRFGSVPEAVAALFSRSADGTINVRSFSATQSQSREFIYAIASVDQAVAALERIAREDAFTIANETIDVSDGGVSGVVMGDVVEFRPDSTPRGVEQPGFATLPTDWALKMFKTVYGVDANFGKGRNGRLEFSLHPRPRGWRQDNIVFWELSSEAPSVRSTPPSWPNDFSRLIGDKAYGLLMADIGGFLVPKTTVVARRIAPFSFGRETGLEEIWIRTSPREQVPGKFTTARGWLDPFKLLQSEDPEGEAISSVLAQKAVSALWSGAAIETSSGELVIEGVEGTGDKLMLGEVYPEPLPDFVATAVRDLHGTLREVMGPVRLEWVYDGTRVWIVQLHRGASISDGDIIVPGDPETWVTFDVSKGLEALRTLVTSLKPDTGISLDRRVGLTSHLADVLRKAAVPARVNTP